MTAALCPRCATPQVPGGSFCGECGNPLEAPALPTPGLAWPEQQPAPAGVLDGLLGRLPVRELLPLHRWWSNGGWRQGGAALFLLMALAPFVLLQLTSEDTDVRRVAVGFAVYFAVLWLVAIRVLVRPESLHWLTLAGIVAFTTVAGVAIAMAAEKQLDASTETVLSSILTVGLPEEVAKALAVAIFLRVTRPRWAPRTFLYAGAVSGLAFGAAEAVTYTTTYATLFRLGDGGLAVSLWRLLSDSLFHACMAGIVACFIGLGAWFRPLRLQLIGFGLLVAGVLHGLYDHWAAGWGGAALAVLTICVFVGYARSADLIGSRVGAHFARPAPPPLPAPPAAPLPNTWGS